MTPPIQIQRIPKRRRRLKPATVRALFWVIALLLSFLAFLASISYLVLHLHELAVAFLSKVTA